MGALQTSSFTGSSAIEREAIKKERIIQVMRSLYL